jgi:CRP-like cAMP-binding protein
MAAFGAGGVIGSFAAVRLASRPRVVSVMAAGFVVAAANLALLGVVRSQVLGYAIVVAAGAGFIVFDVVSVTVFQRAVPQQVLGRVYAIMMTLGFASTLLAAVVAPIVLDRFGLEEALLTGTALPCVVLVFLTPRLRRIARISAQRAAELAERADSLGALGLFGGVSRAGLEQLAAAVKEEHETQGTIVVHEGAEPDDLFIVRAGSLSVYTSGEAGGPPRLIDALGADDWFGEVGLVEHIPRTATVTASTDCTLWRIPGADFLATLEQLPEFPGPLHVAITQRLTRTHPSRAAQVPSAPHLPKEATP